MKRGLIVGAILVVLFSVGDVSAKKCARRCQKKNAQQLNKSTLSLSQKEVKDLLILREEEKLARDVYLYAFDKYSLDIFKNINNSEQRHMDKVLKILTTYGVKDPASSKRGVFKNKKLQELYNSFIKKVDKSLVEALKVGVEIEDLDLKDVKEFKGKTSKQDIVNMYNRLECGSKNHLRAFYAALKENKGEYKPKYISSSDFNEITTSEKSKCGTRTKKQRKKVCRNKSSKKRNNFSNKKNG